MIMVYRNTACIVHSQVSSSAAEPANTVGETEGVGIGLGIVSFYTCNSKLPSLYK